MKGCHNVVHGSLASSILQHLMIFLHCILPSYHENLGKKIKAQQKQNKVSNFTIKFFQSDSGDPENEYAGLAVRRYIASSGKKNLENGRSCLGVKRTYT